MSAFGLEWRQQGQDPEMREKYTCKGDSSSFGSQTEINTAQVTWDNTREWNKIPCQCSANSVLNQWQFETFWGNNPKTQLNYKCSKVPKTTDCVSLQTESAL